MRRENFIQGRQTEFFFMPVAALEIFLESQGDRGLYASYDFCSSARDWDKQLFGLCVWKHGPYNSGNNDKIASFLTSARQLAFANPQIMAQFFLYLHVLHYPDLDNVPHCPSKADSSNTRLNCLLPRMSISHTNWNSLSAICYLFATPSESPQQLVGCTNMCGTKRHSSKVSAFPCAWDYIHDWDINAS